MGKKTNNDYHDEFVCDYQMMTNKEKSFNDVMTKQSRYDFWGHQNRTPEESKNLPKWIKKYNIKVITILMLLMLSLTMTSNIYGQPTKTPVMVESIMYQINPENGWTDINFKFYVKDTKGNVICETPIDMTPKSFVVIDQKKPDSKEYYDIYCFVSGYDPDGIYRSMGKQISRKSVENVKTDSDGTIYLQQEIDGQPIIWIN